MKYLVLFALLVLGQSLFAGENMGSTELCESYNHDSRQADDIVVVEEAVQEEAVKQ